MSSSSKPQNLKTSLLSTGSLGSLTECPLDIRPFHWSPKPWRRRWVCELILNSSSPHLLPQTLKTSNPQNLPTINRVARFAHRMSTFCGCAIGHFESLAQGRSVRSPNVHWTFAPTGYVSSSSKPQNLKTYLLSTGALGSLIECPHFVDVL